MVAAKRISSVTTQATPTVIIVANPRQHRVFAMLCFGENSANQSPLVFTKALHTLFLYHLPSRSTAFPFRLQVFPDYPDMPHKSLRI